jgi:hypothetical protein
MNDFFGKMAYSQQTGLAVQYCTFFLVADAVQNYEILPQQAEQEDVIDFRTRNLRVRFAQIRVQLF